MTEDEYDYEEDLAVNVNALDIEWLDQPRLFMKWSKLSAEARKKADDAKSNLDVVRAEQDDQIRTSYGGEKKPTEAAITNMVIMSSAFRKATRKYHKARFNVVVLDGAVKSFEQRKTSLENLVRLQGQQYFAGPSAPRELTSDFIDKTRDLKESRSREKTKARLKKSRRTK